MSLVERLKEAAITVPNFRTPIQDPVRQQLMQQIADWFIQIVKEEGGIIRQYELKLLQRDIRTADRHPFPDLYLTHNPFLVRTLQVHHVHQQELASAYRTHVNANAWVSPENAKRTLLYWDNSRKVKKYLTDLCGKQTKSGKLTVFTLREPEYSVLSSECVAPNGVIYRAYPTHIDSS
jgi:hypothetical protein